ncbi:short-chain dehydrogenase [Rhodococcus erythropolis]|uniref:Short-chain dehydrogenase n=1 Tax=Rhodococcus erythropolis TaxID=1833 RepID=A0A0C2ZYI4_RHOER|nr:short-chain dehydrogenase [Rhodococcus erythropolis]KIM17515.1 short-chain dehydrogenase [Rhodococcus erythropolis]
MNLNGRVAVVTGASSGIGAAVAQKLADQGASVALLARRKSALDELVSAIRESGGTAASFVVDVTDRNALTAAAALIEDELGSAGIVVNNAGIMLPTPLSRIEDSDWTRQIDLNVGAVNNTVTAFTQQLLRSAEDYGVADLVNTASIAGRNLFPTYSAYAASKAYVIHLSKNLRAEFAPKNVRVSVVEPGIVDSELQSHIADDAARDRLASTRERIEWLNPADIAEVMAYTVGLPAHVNLSEITVLPTHQI